MKRWLSPVWFVLIAAAFFLPFVTISCEAPEGLGELGGALGGEGAEQIPTGGFEVRATGWDLVTGAEPDVKADPEFTELAGQDITGGEGGDISIWALAAFIAAGLGIFLSPLRERVGGVITIVLGAAVVAFLFLLRTEVSGNIPGEAEAFLKVVYEPGYWAALGLGLVAAVWGIIRLVTVEPTAMPPPPATGMPPPATRTGFEPTTSGLQSRRSTS